MTGSSPGAAASTDLPRRSPSWPADARAARRCWPWLRDHRGLLRRSIGAGLVGQFSAVAAAVGGAALAGAVLDDGTGEFPWWLVALTAGAVMVAGAATWWEMVLAHDLAYAVLAGLRVRVFDQLRRIVPSRRPAWRSGEFCATALSDVESLEWLIAHVLGQVVVTAALVGAGATLCGLLAPPVVLVVVPAAVLLLTVPWWRRAAADRQGTAERLASATLQADVVETLDGLAELTAAGALDRRRSLIDRRTRDLVRVGRQAAARSGFEAAVADAVVALAATAALFLVTGQVRDGAVSIVVAPVVLTLVGAVLVPAAQLARTLHRAGALRAALRRIEQVLDEPPSVPPATAARPMSGPLRSDRPGPALELRAVRFGYEPELPVLRDVGFRVERGEIVALVGRSGAGKSTVLALLQRCWDPDGGSIAVGGRDLRTVSDSELRRTVAVVGQDVHLFAGSLAENVRLGRPQAPDGDLWRAVEQAQLAPAIRRLPAGLDTPVGEHGTTLSGGERARVAIARALLMDTPILLLDEAVANLDPATELGLHRALHRGRTTRATLLVAHRAATVARADRVVVLDQGRVVATGTPAATAAHWSAAAR